jgi:type VI secretion system protein ImpG
MLSDQGSEDPHIRRLIQSVALMTARVNMRLGDDYGGFAANLMDALYPQHFQPRPSCAIARFAGRHGADRPAGLHDLYSSGGMSRPARFRPLFTPETSDPDVATIRFDAARSLTFTDGGTWSGATLSLVFDEPVPPSIRLFINGEASLASVVRDAFSFDVAQVAVTCGADKFVSGGSVSWVPPEVVEPLVPQLAGTHPGYELLRDLFLFADKFAFFDIRLPNLAPQPIHEVRILFLPSDRGTRDAALARLGPSHVLTRCAPVANVYSLNVAFGPKTASRSEYVMEGAADRAAVAVESVHLRDGDGKPERHVPHYFHGRRPGQGREGCFWVSHPGAPASSEGELANSFRLMLVDDERRPLSGNRTLSVSAVCCDGGLPAQMICGTSLAGLRDAAGSPVGELVTNATAFQPAPARKGATWGLVSHLRLSHSSLLGPDASVLRDFLVLHAPDGSGARHAIEGVKGVAQRDVTQWMPGAFPPTLVRGVEITLTIDEMHFVGLGLHAWVHVLDRFFAAYAQVNSFTQLVLRSSQTGKEIHRCPPNSGTGPLI